MDTMELLDQAKARAGLSSDSALAAGLGVTKQAVSNWRHGNKLPDAVACEKLAVLSGIPLARVLGIVGEARAISIAEKRVWRKLASAAAVVLATGMAANSPAPAAGFPTNGHAVSGEVVCIMRNAFGGQEGGCRALSLPDRETFAGSA